MAEYCCKFPQEMSTTYTNSSISMTLDWVFKPTSFFSFAFVDRTRNSKKCQCWINVTLNYCYYNSNYLLCSKRTQHLIKFASSNVNVNFRLNEHFTFSIHPIYLLFYSCFESEIVLSLLPIRKRLFLKSLGALDKWGFPLNLTLKCRCVN